MGNSNKSSSRLFAIQILYEMELNGKSFEVIQKNFSNNYYTELEKINNQGKPNKSYIEKLVKGASKNQKIIDDLISLNLKNWKLSRIESLVRSILRISIYELLYETNVPKKVIFNEYIEITKFFFDGEESSLINAVLDAVSKNNDK
tara:strand:+ start:881 stop:1318 length:438 start_codon:yes stop_codon:yes gene_type:complete